MLESGKAMGESRTVTRCLRGQEEGAMGVKCRSELGAMVCMRVHGNVGILPDFSDEELPLWESGQHERNGRVRIHTESPKLRTLPSLMFRLTRALSTGMPPMIWLA